MNSYANRRNYRKQLPLGELLSRARNDLGYTRAQVASACGIGVNSIVRYEKAGIDAIDGQYPPSPKLAALCRHLGIPSSEAFWSCLTPEEFEATDGEAFHDLVNHPSYIYLQNQYETLLKDTHFLKEATKALIGLNKTLPVDEEDAGWFVNELRRIIDRYDDFEERMLQWGCIRLEVAMTVTPGPNSPEAWVLNPAIEGKISNEDETPAKFFQWSVRQRLAEALANMDRLDPELATMSEEGARASMRNQRSPEDDLPSPPSSENDET